MSYRQEVFAISNIINRQRQAVNRERKSVAVSPTKMCKQLHSYAVSRVELGHADEHQRKNTDKRMGINT